MTSTSTTSVYQLRGCEIERGAEAAYEAARRVDEDLRAAMPGVKAPSFSAAMQLARAFEYYMAGRRDAVPSEVLRAFRMDPPPYVESWRPGDFGAFSNADTSGFKMIRCVCSRA